MQFYLNFDEKSVQSASLETLEAYLNSFTTGMYHGDTFEAIFINFIDSAIKSKTLKKRHLYKKYAEIDLKVDFPIERKLSINTFQGCLNMLPFALKLVDSIKVENKDFAIARLEKDIFRACHEAPKNQKELKTYNINLENIKQANNVQHIDCKIRHRFECPRPLTKSLTYIRILYPFNTKKDKTFRVLEEILGNLLRRNGLRLPGYQEIYFQIARTMNEAKNKYALENWHEYAYCELDYDSYRSLKNDGKFRMLLSSVGDGLKSLAKTDHLDSDIIVEVLSTIDRLGTNIELVYMEKKKEGAYTAKIVYSALPVDKNGNLLYRLKLLDAASNEIGECDIAVLSPLWVPYSLGSLTIKKKEVVIKGRGSQTARSSRRRDKLPKEYRFSIDKLKKNS